MTVERLQDAVARVNRSRILFAHQSVGANLLEGLDEIARELGAPIAVASFDGARPWNGIASARLGQNGDPRSKTAAFVAAVAHSTPAVAVQKYCYVDLRSASEAQALFHFYRDRMAALAQENPSTRIVHVTMPLKTVRRGLKATIGRWLGRGRDHAAENAAREAFNDLMRASFGVDAVFDLADVEAGGARPRSLREEWTSDGGHLNARGRREAAERFLEFLARVTP